MKTLSKEPLISESATISESEFGRYTEIGDDCKIVESSLGDYSYVMDRSDIIYSEIGKFSNIASDVRINPGNHPMEWVSQHHFLYRRKMYNFHEEDNDAFFSWRRRQKVKIGHDTWIGTKAVILPGLSVSNGAVVAAGSVVTKDVAPYSIVAGVPAKPIRTRFPKAIWQELERIGWWDWQHDLVKERLDDFYDIRLFLQKYGDQ